MHGAQSQHGVSQNRPFAQSPTGALINLKVGCPVWLYVHRVIRPRVKVTLAGIVRNTCRTPGCGADAPNFEITTTSTPNQKRALELIS